MPELSANLRKAAVLIRSLDEATAAKLLAQLPPDESAAVRAAVDRLDYLDDLDPEEQADVAAEMRRAAPVAVAGAKAGVELSLSTSAYQAEPSAPLTYASKADLHQAALHGEVLTGPRFDFLEKAPIASLVPFLAREHAQTVAVVLSYLSPTRASAVLAALPARLQAETLERLSMIGETDPDSLKIVEQELAGWVAAQSSQRRNSRAAAAAQAILAAASDSSRNTILLNLKTHKNSLAEQFTVAAKPMRKSASDAVRPADRFPTVQSPSPRLSTQLDSLRATRAALAQQPTLPIAPPRPARPQATAAPKPAPPRFNFDDLIQLGAQSVSALLSEVAPNMLVLALTGSSDALVEKFAGQMPRRAAKGFRKQLRNPGPTRLSDVDAAQQHVASMAASKINSQKTIAAVAER